MDKASKYRTLIKTVIQHYVYPDDQTNYEEFETQVVFDDKNGHYYLMDIGWNGSERIHGFTLHLDLKEDKIWIQQDWTEEGVANELVAQGVPKEDIVLAFHAPYKRKHTGFATA